jgi:hypothetical protein
MRSARSSTGESTVGEGPELLPRDVELDFADAYDKLLRATDGLDLSRDLLSSARDYSQAKIANDQNEVVKRLTVIASILLVPTFIVGLYGQNFATSPSSGGASVTGGAGAGSSSRRSCSSPSSAGSAGSAAASCAVYGRRRCRRSTRARFAEGVGA